MDGARFDRLARNVARRVSRRALLAAAGGLAIVKSQRVSASQLTPSTCGASGEVCTMLVGCCDGLTCVTSAINTNYGVCIAGEGGTVSIGTTLISPFSENVEQEVAAMAAGAAETDSTTTTTDVVAEREQRIADKKARKEDRRDDKKLRKDNQQNEQQDRREDQRLARDLRRGLDVRVSISCPQQGPSQILTIANREALSINVAKISSLLNLTDDEPFLATQMIVESGTTLQVHFGVRADLIPGGIWQSDVRVFEDSPLEGVRVELTSGDIRRACCDGTTACLGDDAKNRRKRQNRRGRNGGKSRNKNG